MSKVNIGVSIRAEDYEVLRTDEYDRIAYDICSSCLVGLLHMECMAVPPGESLRGKLPRYL